MNCCETVSAEIVGWQAKPTLLSCWARALPQRKKTLKGSGINYGLAWTFHGRRYLPVEANAHSIPQPWISH